MALILLIDDSGFARNLTAKILKKAGHEIMEAEDGLKGLKLLTGRTPDCIISDMLMPEMDGQKFLMALRAASLDIPVIMLTADVQDKTHASCMEWGALDVLYKPPREESLLAAVDRAVGKERNA
jgi:CheY-like chemotaxis protein